MQTQRASLSLGRWSLWLLLLGLVVPSASARDLGRGPASWGAGRQIRGRRKSPNPVSPTLTRDQEVDPGTRKPVSFTVKETVCPRTTQQPPEECDFKENGVRLGWGWAITSRPPPRSWKSSPSPLSVPGKASRILFRG
uniref:Cathelicidin n=1 Tax=Capra hircus TaxID=9925 RepID=A0A482CYG9_CAPHI|nr:cathelicidin [Capra hircus]